MAKRYRDMSDSEAKLMASDLGRWVEQHIPGGPREGRAEFALVIFCSETGTQHIATNARHTASPALRASAESLDKANG